MILCLAPFDNGGQLALLSEALNKYTNLDSRCLTFTQTYLQYDTDLLLSDFDTLTKQYELRDLVKSADFFIFSELLPNDPNIKDILINLGIHQNINPRNTIIRTAGSYSRVNAEHYLLEWMRHEWIYAGPYSDWALYRTIGRIAPVNYICPVDKIPKAKPPKDKIRICFAPTKKEKGIDEFTNVMTALIERYDNVEVAPITNKTWKEAIEIKSTCNITFDQFMLSHYANSSIESMYLKHAVLSKISSWCFLIHPELPIGVVSNEQELEEELEYLINNPYKIKEIGEAGREYTLKQHHPKVVAKQWENLIAHVLKH